MKFFPAASLSFLTNIYSGFNRLQVKQLVFPLEHFGSRNGFRLYLMYFFHKFQIKSTFIYIINIFIRREYTPWCVYYNNEE